MGRSPDATVNGMPPKLTFAFACLHTGDQTDDWLVRVRFSSSKEGAQSANRSVSFVLQLHGIFNPQPNPQKAMSCTTCAVFGRPRVLVSCCKTSPRCAVTAAFGQNRPRADLLSLSPIVHISLKVALGIIPLARPPLIADS